MSSVVHRRSSFLPSSKVVDGGRRSALLPNNNGLGLLGERKTAAITDDDDDYSSDNDDQFFWMPPPSITGGGGAETSSSNQPPGQNNGGEPLRVDFRCACFKLTNISTADFTAMVKFVVVFEWNDIRLISRRRNSMNADPKKLTTNDLPCDLWGPDLILENSHADCQVIYDSFLLLDADTGRLKRTVTFHGTIYNPMELDDFPFDFDIMELKFISICNWRTLDGLRFGNDAVNRTYTLHPLIGINGIDFFTMGWNGRVNEFRILGWSQKTACAIDNPQQPMSFKFKIHMAREVRYYYIKILLPLWLLVITSVAAFSLDPTDDLGDKYEFLVTLLLSAIAFLYIIQDSLPKVGKYTVIDKIVIVSLVSLVFSVLFSYLIKVSESPQQMNILLAWINQGGYWLTNASLIIPPQWRHFHGKAILLKQIETENDPTQKQTNKNNQRKGTESNSTSSTTGEGAATGGAATVGKKHSSRPSRMHDMQSTGAGNVDKKRSFRLSRMHDMQSTGAGNWSTRQMGTSMNKAGSSDNLKLPNVTEDEGLR